MDENKTEVEEVQTKENDELTKKELVEQERKKRQKKRAKEIQLKKLKAKLPWLIFVVVIIVIVYGIVVLAQKSKMNESDRLGVAVSVMGRNHISVDTPHDPYNSNPPTSGPHAQDLPWGFKDSEIRDENAIHNLEHGGIWITYKNLDEESINTLRKIANQNRLSVIVSPREANDSNVAVASWGRLMKLDTVDVDKINAYIKQNKNRSPEPLAR